jgi:hypothetical protein
LRRAEEACQKKGRGEEEETGSTRVGHRHWQVRATADCTPCLEATIDDSLD